MMSFTYHHVPAHYLWSKHDPLTSPRSEGVGSSSQEAERWFRISDFGPRDKTLQDRFPRQGVKTAMPSALKGGSQTLASRNQSSDCTSTSTFTQTVSFLSFLWPHHVACRILVPDQDEAVPSAMEAQILNHWTTRDVPNSIIFLMWA